MRRALPSIHLIRLANTQGAHDAMAIIDWPNDETARLFTLVSGQSGNLRPESSRAYTTEEMQRILERVP